MLTIDVIRQINNNDLPNDDEFMRWAAAAYQRADSAEIAITICDLQQSQQLNHDYRNQNKPTNVLSFNSEMPAIEDITHLGDIIICAPVVKAEAKQQGKTEQAHWAHMVIHGTLHLQGYDHIDSADALKMETLEIEIMHQLQFDNPYQTTRIAN